MQSLWSSTTQYDLLLLLNMAGENWQYILKYTDTKPIKKLWVEAILDLKMVH